MQSIAFNLNEFAKANNYYFDNFGVWVQKPKPVSDWVDIAINGNFESATRNTECFYVTEQGVGGSFVARITDGIGKDGSNAVKVQSADDAATDWSTQFFIRLPYQLPAGTKYRVSFDYKADKAGDFETQAHAEPSDYIHNACIGTGSFSTEWQTYEKTGTISGDMSKSDKPMQTIAFNLAKNKTATEFIFDNIKFEVEASALEGLAKNPAVDPNFYPLGEEFIEIAQDQGKDLDNFTRTELVEGEKYNTYTANGDLNIAMKMEKLDVTDCDYLIIRFAEPVAAGWHLAFWSGQDLTDVAEGTMEYKYVFADDPKCGVQNGVLPQICMMTFFGGFQAPLTAKVLGIYKHQIGGDVSVPAIAWSEDSDVIYNLRGQKVTGTLKPGLYIKNGKKVVIK
jgi:hypothetical protein